MGNSLIHPSDSPVSSQAPAYSSSQPIQIVPYKERFALSVADVAMLTSLSEDTIRRACQSGELEYIEIGTRTVIRPAAIDEWMERHAKKTTKRQRR
jgi:excisionase family DNA binding protein